MTIRPWPLLAVVLLLAVPHAPARAQSYDAPAVAPTWPATPPGEQHFYIVTMHVDGLTNIAAGAEHPAEALPTEPLPGGGGLIRSAKPDEKGDWRMRAFAFLPPQVIVHQGDTVVLHFVGSQGASHRIAVEGAGDPVALRRGEVKTVRVKAEKPGLIRYWSLDRAPSMQGQVVVLARG